MMEKRFKLTVQEVLDKQFNIDFKGYSSHEVDEFLDLVISDYQEYDEMIEGLGKRLQEYEQANMALKAKIVELEGKKRQYRGTNPREFGYFEALNPFGKRSIP